MKQRLILFSAPMVRAILEGTKTQTRRIVKWDNHAGVNLAFSGLSLDSSAPGRFELYSRDGDGRWQERTKATCPYGQPGDRLWVERIAYAADDQIPGRTLGWGDDYREWGWKLKPSIFMPRWASRITLEITDVRVQRLQEINDEDARAEGYGVAFGPGCFSRAFDSYWEEINGKGSWSLNPWVWALTFQRVETSERAS